MTWKLFLIQNGAGCAIAGRRIALGVAMTGASVLGAIHPPVSQFHTEVQPILLEYCADCHADGAKKGGVAFDDFKSDATLLQPDLWLRVLKNTRAGLMPPRNKPRPSPEEQQKLENWIKFAVFGIDRENPDPGRVTVRRLNRIEYRNTIRDLMGIDFNTEVEFPPDDTGYGFDNIGDVLSISPMLLEKYLTAAKAIVSQAVPTVGKVMAEQTVPGRHFHTNEVASGPGQKEGGRGTRQDSFLSLNYYEPAAVSAGFKVSQAGNYRLSLELAAKGNFEFDPGRCRVTFKLDGREVLTREFGWYDNKAFIFDFAEHWEPGEKRVSLALEPLTPIDKKVNSLELRLVQVTVRGPTEREQWIRPKNYERFFTGEIPENAVARRLYARQLLGEFAAKASRRPVDDQIADRLAALAELIYQQPGNTFETGVAHAMVAVLASPRFLFRLEEPQNPAGPKTDETSLAPASTPFPKIDEYSLASRLSYFLWSTMPDQELLELAGRGELRQKLAPQVKRMLDDKRSQQLVQNFTGQWLQTRDVEGISVNARAILARDSGLERQARQQQEGFRAQFAQRNAARAASTNEAAAGSTNAVAGTNANRRANGFAQRPGFNRRFNQPRFELDRDLRDAMRHETELFFASIVREDRPVTELIESDYTFLNEKLAQLYGLTNLNVTGSEMRRVTLPEDSPRGGVLTQGSALVVTSNPDRTSPVKRGLFILENFLGTPAPPPPPNIPALEAVDKDFKDHEPTLREALQAHRDKPLCASCHERMDPIGLALENFNAMGMWRDKERNQTIDTAGRLITGESFATVRELKQILARQHRLDFYRCLTDKMLTYAIGRGMEYYDAETIDRIVQRLERENGRFSALLMGIIESAPFQKMRTQATALVSRENETVPDPAPDPRVAQSKTNP